MVGSISVIIPTLNEAAHIEDTIKSVFRESRGAEVIVVDGGSDDATIDLARQYVRVLDASRGRAQQMNAGAAASCGDVLVFLHADTHLPENGLQAIQNALDDPGALGGCFRTTFDDDSFWMRVWSWRFWMKWPALAFGDRALFVRGQVFEEMGGFADQPMFEDLELVRQIRRRGRFVFLNEAVRTSARRFLRHGTFKQQVHNSALWLGWMFGIPAVRLKRFYSDNPEERGIGSPWQGNPQTEVVR